MKRSMGTRDGLRSRRGWRGLGAGLCLMGALALPLGAAAKDNAKAITKQAKAVAKLNKKVKASCEAMEAPVRALDRLIINSEVPLSDPSMAKVHQRLMKLKPGIEACQQAGWLKRASDAELTEGQTVAPAADTAADPYEPVIRLMEGMGEIAQKNGQDCDQYGKALFTYLEQRGETLHAMKSLKEMPPEVEKKYEPRAQAALNALMPVFMKCSENETVQRAQRLLE